MLKGAIVGCGGVTHVSHLPIFQALKDVKIVAICDKVSDVATQTAKDWGIPKVYGDFSRMVDEENLDFVDICSPPQTHFPLALQAMEIGLHVLVEKPMEVTLEKCDEMIEACKRAKVNLMVAHSQRYWEGGKIAKELISEGVII